MPPHSNDFDAAVDAIMGRGFSRPAAIQLATEALDEVKARRRAAATTERILAMPYRQWLQSASPEYVWDKPVHQVLCSHIDDIIAGRTRRLAIFMSPRIGKSEAVTVRLPVYWQEAFPGSRVIIGAYNRDLATLFTRNSLRLFRARNPDMVESEAQDEWSTKAGGSVLAAGVGSGVTGRGADCLSGETLIRTTEGLIPIERLVSMTERPPVLAYDHFTGRPVWSPVLAAREVEADSLIEVVTMGGRRLTCTPDHRICVSGWDYEPARLLAPGDRLRVMDGDLHARDRVVGVLRVATIGGSPVYDLQTEHHNFFAEDILVHNCIIIDDPVKGHEEAISVAYQNRVWQWWQNDIRTRVNDVAKTPIILIQCIAEGERVLMGDGTWRVVESVSPGERVASYDFEKGFISSPVTAARCSGEDDLLAVRTDRHSLVTNGRHPYLVIPGSNMRTLSYEWRQADELRVGDVLVTVKAFNNDACLRRTPIGDYELTEDFMWLFGYMMGDGWVTKSHQSRNGFYSAAVCVAQGVYEDRNERATGLIGRYGGQRVYLTSGRYYRSDSTRFGRDLIDLGLSGGAKGKRVPDWIYQSSQEAQRSFIRGLIDADGSRNRNRAPETYAFTTSNPDLEDDVRLLALTCGLRPTSVHTYDTVSRPPNSDTPVESVWSHIDITFRQDEFEGQSFISPWSDHRERLPYRSIRLDKVRSIEPAGRGRVYDLSVENENFVADGLVVHNTRWHELDLAGRILEQDKRGIWKVISFPALAGENDILGRRPGESIWPERLPEEELEALKSEMGTRFDALYQQDPTPAEGGLVEERWFWKAEIGSRPIVAEVRAWDIAATAVSRKSGNPDWTVGVRMALVQGDGKLLYAVRDVQRIRAEVGDRDLFIQSVALADGPEVLQVIEENDDGDKSVTHALRMMLAPSGIGVEGVKPKNDKVVRSTNARSALQRGEMFMCDGRWNYDFVSEMVRFPNGRHDDQVDAWSSAYNHLIIRAIKVSIR